MSSGERGPEIGTTVSAPSWNWVIAVALPCLQERSKDPPERCLESGS